VPDGPPEADLDLIRAQVAVDASAVEALIKEARANLA
jgi:hypothetical protein